ncbi:MAG: hypothetical protein NTU44_17090, partial [Bacteroidetes bacterium]|nr:hypothetical protein [Bacteroidota bacterium]
MKGPQFSDDPGCYGTITVENSANNPPARREVTCGWIDAEGNFWFFGGEASGGNKFNDLWKYDPNTNQWAWMKGSNMMNQNGVYGIPFIPAPQNTPGARWAYQHWKDAFGNFWLFGGGDQYNNVFNDLWKFDPQTLDWTWISGTDLLNDPGSCLGLCTPSDNHFPACRYENTACWKSQCDIFYLFGGLGTGSYGMTHLADLWCFDPTLNYWTFVKGSLTNNSPAVQGTINVPAPGNRPGALSGSCSWTDLSGNLWLFGGGDAANCINALWRYTPDNQCPSCSCVATATISPDTSMCPGDSIILIASGGTTFHWTPVSSLSNPNIPNPTVFPDTTTLYTVTISGCNDSVVKTVLVSVVYYNTIISADTAICKNDSISLHASGGISYAWFPTINMINPDSADPVVFPNVNTTYSVNILTSACTVTRSVDVSVYPLPDIHITPSDTTICKGDSISIEALGAVNYQWFPSTFLSAVSGNPVTASPTQNIVYTVTGTDQHSCQDTAQFTINVHLFNHSITRILTPETTICKGDSIQLNATGGIQYLWSTFEWSPSIV